MKKRALSMLLALLALLALAVPAGAAGEDAGQGGYSVENMTDLDAGWKKESVAWALESGYVQPESESFFGADTVCQRWEAVYVLWRVMGSPEPKLTQCPYTDVSPDEEYYKAVLWANETGVTKGVQDFTFSADGPLLRSQAVTFIHRAAEKPAARSSSAFTDVTVNDYYAGAVNWGCEKGIVDGKSETSFEPNANVTRAEMVTFLYRWKGRDAAAAKAAYEAMTALKDEYPEGTPWTNDNEYDWTCDPRYSIVYGYGCAGFAFMLSDAAFGDAPARQIQAPISLEDVRVGDILRINDDTHSVIVLEVRENSVIIAEGNFNSSVHWGRELSREEVESAVYMYTRYQDQQPPAG